VGPTNKRDTYLRSPSSLGTQIVFNNGGISIRYQVYGVRPYHCRWSYIFVQKSLFRQKIPLI